MHAERATVAVNDVPRNKEPQASAVWFYLEGVGRAEKFRKEFPLLCARYTDAGIVDCHFDKWLLCDEGNRYAAT